MIALNTRARDVTEAKKWDYRLEDGKAVVDTMAKAAHFLGVSAKTLQTWISQGCPGEKGYYPIKKMFDWAYTVGPWGQSLPIDGDPLMGGGEDTEWLEKYREEKTLLARLERKQKERELVRIEEILDPLMEGAAVVRAAGERLGREYGSEAQEMINEAVQEFVDGLRQQMGGGE